MCLLAGRSLEDCGKSHPEPARLARPPALADPSSAPTRPRKQTPEMHEDHATTVTTALRQRFTAASSEALAHAAAAVRWQTLAEGDLLPLESQQADDLLIVCSGRLAVYARDAAGGLRLREIVTQPGRLLGKPAGEQGPRQTTIVALAAGVVGVISSADLSGLSGATAAHSGCPAGMGRSPTANRLRILAADLSGAAAGLAPSTLAVMQDVPRLGTLARYLETSDGIACIVTDHQLESGDVVRVRQYPQEEMMVAGVVGALAKVASTLRSPDGRSILMLGENTGQLLGLTAPQNWERLSEAMGLLFRGGSLSTLQIDAFRVAGELLLEDAAVRAAGGAEVVCGCTTSSATTLRMAARGIETVEELMRRTGAGTICGGCRGRLAGIVEQSEGQLCRLKTVPLAAGSLLAILTPAGETPLAVGKPGQHARIEAFIDGRWIGRPYTLLTSGAAAYEIGVKIETDGLFSEWISQAAPNTLVRVHRPEGEVCPAPADPRPLVYVVAGIGVTLAIAGLRACASHRRVHIYYSYRTAATAPFLPEIRQGVATGGVRLVECETSLGERMAPACVAGQIAALGPCEVVVCGPADFNSQLVDAIKPLPAVEVQSESFYHAQRGEGAHGKPGEWRLPNFKHRHSAGEPQLISTALPAHDQAAQFLREYHAECQPGCDPAPRIEVAVAELHDRGAWRKTPEELGFAARLAWRNAVRCVGRLSWRGLHLRDCRDLTCPDTMAEALFDHLRFAFNGGDLRAAITVFDSGDSNRPGPRIWNPQLLRYAGVRLRTGRQIGDPATNELTARIRTLGWEPKGGDFELLPLVIETADQGPRLYELPADCRQEVAIAHAAYPWLETLGLKWHAIPAVSDMALDAGGVSYSFAPFNGWYLNTEIAARNLTDTNRYDLLPRIAERMGLDILNDRNLWRDKSLVMLNEALLESFDRAGVKIADHHQIGREFLEFCRAEQQAGREPHGRWMWLVPPVSSSTTVLYQEGFKDLSFKPAYRYQTPIWSGRPWPEGTASGAGHAAGGCPVK